MSVCGPDCTCGAQNEPKLEALSKAFSDLKLATADATTKAKDYEREVREAKRAEREGPHDQRAPRRARALRPVSVVVEGSRFVVHADFTVYAVTQHGHRRVKGEFAERVLQQFRYESYLRMRDRGTWPEGHVPPQPYRASYGDAV